MNILDNIHGHKDLEQLNREERVCLCQQIRDFLVESVSKTGGHLASNLGVVELSVAIETVFDTTLDRLVFDVGHQSYVHKLLTDRKSDFANLRQFDGMAGFPKPSESVSDAFVAGHSSNSVSIALGMARARTLNKDNYHVLALLGDGAATGGMVYEGLNDAAESGEPMIVILNDNEMSIDRNVGGMATHLSKLRTKEKYLGMKEKYRVSLSKIPGGNIVFRITRNIKDMIRRMLIPQTIFENMGFTYLGPVDGHDTERLISLLRVAKDMKRPVLLHVLTQKGMGYAPAQEHPEVFHGVGKFDPATGSVPPASGNSFSGAFGTKLCQLAAENETICAITAAMPGGTGLMQFKELFPNRMFDVGIAEEHAVSMAGGLAKQGMVPVVAIYSTFLQRAYDLILQDIGLLGLHVVFAVDRAGLVGEDGETHHGIYDMGFLRHVANMTILCPANTAELDKMLAWSVNECKGPVALRYPRGGNGAYLHAVWEPDKPVIVDGDGPDFAIVTYGKLVNNALDACRMLESEHISGRVVRLGTVHPLPVDQLQSALLGCRHVLIVEEISEHCAVGDRIIARLQNLMSNCTFSQINLGDSPVTHGAVDRLLAQHGMDAKSIASHIQEVLRDEN